jgi:rubrerythrin
VVNLAFNCNNKIKNEKDEEKICGNLVKYDLNLLEIEPTKNDKHTDKIQLTDKLGIVLKYPTFNSVNKLDVNSDDMEQILDVIINCIDYIYDDEQVYYAKDSTKKELLEFVENMKQTDLEKVQDFFNTLPKIKKDLHFKCDKCGYEEDIIVEGIQNFFV